MISIIIPVFNRESIVLETLQSIKNQVYSNWECIIIDDGSTDATLDVISKFITDDNRFMLQNRPLNSIKGPSSCRNFGFTLANGNFIQFFDSDDIMHPQHLERKIAEIQDADFISCKVGKFSGLFESQFQPIENFQVEQLPENLFEDFATGKFALMMVTPLWKKTILDANMPMKENMAMLEDHELYARILNTKIKGKMLRETLIFIRRGNDSLSMGFQKNLNSGLDSYLMAKSSVLSLQASDIIKTAIVKELLSFFRLGLAHKDYDNAEKCLRFINEKKLITNLKHRVSFVRILFLYRVFKLLGRGDTKFKRFLKI